MSETSHLARVFPVLSIYAAGIAFFFLLSMVPFLVVTLGLVDVFSPVDISDPLHIIVKDLLPQQEFLNVDAILVAAEKAGGKGLITVTFFFALWSASSFMGSLSQALHLIFSTESQAPKSGWRVRLYSIGMLLIWSLFLALTAWLFLVAPVVEAWLVAGLEWPAFQAALLKASRFLILFLMFVAAFGASYRLNAQRGVTNRQCLEGGVLATVGWLVAGWAFTNWLPAIWKQSLAFGALGSVVATLMWAYAAAWIVLLGAVWVLLRHRRSQKI